MDGSTKDLNFALVCAGGDAPPPVPVLGEPSYVVAANGGLARVLGMGLRPDVIVGRSRFG